jgi:hypothetical protein
VKNVLQERAYMALQATMSKPRNQWHEQLLAQVDDEPVSQKIWPQIPVEPCRGYDWPKNAP